ncbi:penicillin-binding protein activator [uncultured Aquitalea sp.]|uniref:penicillin-binding protein activator n=1 Tax=uncultured Aquitalea sp. TaxID=540272 RepID=UPI0025FBB23D|nr:penicillin-binding protein activator [uncultured Aquitalea sp.]
MQRLAPLLVGVMMMVWLPAARAQTPDYIIQLNDAPLNSVSGKPAKPASSPAAQAVKPAAAAAKPGARLKIGLLLPTESRLLGEAAAVVRNGFEAAQAAEPVADIEVIDANEKNAAEKYREAVASGVNVMVGPLSRSGIAAVAPIVNVPTLALNSFGKEVAPNAKLYSLSLNVEAEARQIAQLMREDGRANPLIVSDGEVLSSRLQQAFAEAWRAQTGKTAAQVDYAEANLSDVARAAGMADGVFLALEPAAAAKVKQALMPELAVYATSQISTRSPDPQLAGTRYIDMPWFLMPEHPAVKRYPRPAETLTLQTERLYALGIDAYRLAVELGKARNPSAIRLDGVTGDLKPGKDRVFERQLPVSLIGESMH